MHHSVSEINLFHTYYYYLVIIFIIYLTLLLLLLPLNEIKMYYVFSIHSGDQSNIECMRKENFIF